MSKTPKLQFIDLGKCCCKKPGTVWKYCHPDIRDDKQYLAKIDGEYFGGRFKKEWYGWSFTGWGRITGLSLSKPGATSIWEGLWEIQ